mgnify:CR=1 FL=1
MHASLTRSPLDAAARAGAGRVYAVEASDIAEVAARVFAAAQGWVVRDVHRGTALIEGRMGLIEVDQGDFVPGLGRVDAIPFESEHQFMATLHDDGPGRRRILLVGGAAAAGGRGPLACRS